VARSGLAGTSVPLEEVWCALGTPAADSLAPELVEGLYALCWSAPTLGAADRAWPDLAAGEPDPPGLSLHGAVIPAPGSVRGVRWRVIERAPARFTGARGVFFDEGFAACESFSFTLKSRALFSPQPLSTDIRHMPASFHGRAEFTAKAIPRTSVYPYRRCPASGL